MSIVEGRAEIDCGFRWTGPARLVWFADSGSDLLREGAIVARFTYGLVLLAGVGLGCLAVIFGTGSPQPVHAASNDRYQDYVMATGAVSINAKIQTDGVWMLDYKSGKLLATVIDKAQGKIIGWAEVDLVAEFEVAPKQDVHFMMTTGYITQGQSALYLAETTTGKFGVYTMGPGQNGNGIAIRRHDISSFRKPANPGPQGKADDGKEPAIVPVKG